ncbi:LysE family translocator [Pseudodesulfovibrio piezophilus]|uniref:Lysine exporter protein (LYSE/YGGA) n=1 Tax=Pseudodesulfovibrio piezophilus (strain DSM 21447 / JCM 15486 / C1TLV30) TaxID=1322246 RepID=M1WR38_PSEP2|nr:LysE family translocator [Pseudodesulfovibrio piezophilus]CCH49329.1 Lysine exporter protein (LYSE/YGGA) [Pseudodesulfovibrio piezophilus C1TLV30]
MFGIHDLALFIISGLLLNITPGQDVAYIVSRSAGHGWKIGIVAALGVGTGCFVHVFSAALGLSAILATSATAFTVVKFIGAGYLVWVGLAMWRRAGSGQQKISVNCRASLRKVYTQGFLTNALNPKVALFFLAFLPQFVMTEAPSKPLAFLILGILFTFNAVLINLIWAWVGARAASFFQGGGKYVGWIKRSAGTLFIALGVRLACTKSV